jgi:hypothetical protein
MKCHCYSAQTASLDAWGKLQYAMLDGIRLWVKRLVPKRYLEIAGTAGSDVYYPSHMVIS